MEILEKEKPRFRIIILDLKKKGKGSSRTISLKDGDHSIDDIKKKLMECFSRSHSR
ncbi:MAG: hypothetical protein M1416_02680 [Candidatus Pacearchaeota archaeon]|nr:hypothetical protein [Candidatus Pacearchaeota archaeon]